MFISMVPKYIINMKKLLIFIFIFISFVSYSQLGNFLFNQHYGQATTSTCAGVNTYTPISVWSTSATVGGEVITTGGTTVSSRGIVYSLNPNPETGGTTVTSGSGLGNFNVTLTSLTPNTRYYYRAFAVNATCTSYGQQFYFDTPQISNVPTVVTYTMSDIQSTYATAHGEVTSDGGATVTERGFTWNQTGQPNVYEHDTIRVGSGVGTFSDVITGLSEGNTYYLRAFAKNSNGYAYGDTTIFLTNTQTDPDYTVETGDIIVFEGQPIITGRVTSWDNPTLISEVGFCVSTNSSWLGRATPADQGNYTGWYSYKSWADSTTYYVVAYAYVEGFGYVYGEMKSLYFTYGENPTIITYDPTNVVGGSATLNGRLISAGVTTITAKGFAYGIYQNPTLSDNYTTNGTAIGTYSASVSSLSYNTLYYYRAYVTFNHPSFGTGTIYGAQKEFTTGETSIDPGIAVQNCNVLAYKTGVTGYPVMNYIDLGSSLGQVTVATNPSYNPIRVMVYSTDNVLIKDTGYWGNEKFTSIYPLGLSDRYLFTQSLSNKVDPITGLVYGFDDIPGMADDGFPEVKVASTTSLFTFIKDTSEPYVLLKVYAPMSGTSWSINITCPQ